MKCSSEYVTNAHPDRLCDALAANLINRIQKQDKESSHAAVEVFASKDTIIFGGEVTTTLKINKKLLKEIISETFNDCGYAPNKREIFTKDEVKLAKDTKVINLINKQSPDIARATTLKKEDTGFNDQGLFFGSYCNLTPTGQGVAKYLAQSFGEYLFEMSTNVKYYKLGSDIKIIFTLDVEEDGMTPIKVESVIVAIPHSSSKTEEEVYTLVKDAYCSWSRDISKKYDSYKNIVKALSDTNIKLTVNGTGRYVNHGYASDASMTGRKLAVNNMSAGPVWSMCQIGGGSYIKPFHASDFLLPMVANRIAKAIVDAGYSKYINVSSACAIGSKTIEGLTISGDDNFMTNKELRKKVEDYFTTQMTFTPNSIFKEFKIFTDQFDFYKIAKNNFVGNNCTFFETEELTKSLKQYCE